MMCCLFFLEVTDKKHFFYSFGQLVSISVQYKKCIFVLLMAAETKKKVWWNAAVCTGVVCVLISIQNVSVKTLSLVFMTAQTTAAVLSWFVDDSYWNSNLYYGLGKYEKHWGWIPELLKYVEWGQENCGYIC